MTRTDDQQQFGLPAPVDAAAEVNRSIGGSTVLTVALQEGTLDLTLGLDTGHIFQILPDSSGYEAWQAKLPGKSIIAVGGGELETFQDG